MKRTLDREQALHFRDEFRNARAAALSDAEGFSAVVLCLERLGAYLSPGKQGLRKKGSELVRFAGRSPLAGADSDPRFHTRFEHLYDLVRNGRNDAVHEGASARQLTTSAVILALILEDALVMDKFAVSDYMVRDPVCAHQWEPVSFVRQKMLANSFSFLPLHSQDGDESRWSLVSDRALARYLRPNDDRVIEVDNRSDRLIRPLAEAISSRLALEVAICLDPETPIHEVAASLDHRPALVVPAEDPRRLLGIITAFDLL